MIVVAAILMLATMLGGLALRSRNMRARSNEAAPPAERDERRSQPGRGR
jgi:hypothetical protein